MLHLREKAKDLWRNILSILNLLSAAAIFLMAILITGDVVGRFFFNKPIPGTTEMVMSALSAIVFLALPYTLHIGRHVRSTVALSRFPRSIKTMVDIGNNIIGAFIFSIMCRYCWDSAYAGWLIREFEGVQLRVPVYPIRFLIFITSGLVAMQFVFDLLQSFHEFHGLGKGAE